MTKTIKEILTKLDRGEYLDTGGVDQAVKDLEAIIEQAKPKKYTGGEAAVNVDSIGELEGYQGYNAGIDQYESNLKTALYGKESTDV